MDKNRNAVEIFNKYAKQYQERFMDVSIYHDSFDFFCAAINKKEAEVLELACGPGNITQYILKQRPDLKILGTDLSENMLIQARINNPAAEFRLMDARKLNSLSRKFDGIMCGFCLPYLSKEETQKLFYDAGTVLNNEGSLYLSTMEDDYEKSGLRKGSGGEEMFMHYYTSEMLTGMLTAAGFNVLKEQRKFTKDTTDNIVTDLILIAQK